MEVKLTEVDILAIAEDGSYTTIECQVQAQKIFCERSLFYLGKLTARLLATSLKMR